MWTEHTDEMLRFLKENHEKRDVIVMPDFFHDRLINKGIVNGFKVI